MSSPVVDGAGNIFFGSQDDHLYGVSSDGKVLWSVELPGDVDSSVAIHEDGTIIVGCDDGNLRALRAD
jgi:outer membrane protein assembly factor BamB